LLHRLHGSSECSDDYLSCIRSATYHMHQLHRFVVPGWLLAAAQRCKDRNAGHGCMSLNRSSSLCRWVVMCLVHQSTSSHYSWLCYCSLLPAEVAHAGNQL
jgi:hypothetical protein